MFNKNFLKDNITIFSNYTCIDKCSSEYENYSKNYKTKVVPIFIENVKLQVESSLTTKTNTNVALGEINVILSFNDNTSKCYTFVEGQKVEIKYIEKAKYNLLKLEEQNSKYFSISKDLFFINGIYNASKKIDGSEISQKYFESLGFDRYLISEILFMDNLIKFKGYSC